LRSPVFYNPESLGGIIQMASRNSAAPAIDVQRLLERGAESLQRREWRQAHELFRQAVTVDPVPPAAWEGLATAAICLDDASTYRSANERAYREYLERHDFRGAARAAIQLAVYHDAYRGEMAIANGWFERARSLLDTVPAADEHAWLAFWKAHLAIHVHEEIGRGEPSLVDAARISQTCNIGGELSLLMRGLRSLLAISGGSIDEGLRRLDEATTEVISGNRLSPLTVGWTFCYLLEACENVRDFDRASQWIDRAMETEREIGVRHHAGACRSHYIGILLWRGDYAGAEREVETMRQEIGDIAPTYTALCDIRLGEVRRRQGRLDEAAALLEPLAAQPLGMLSLAALALDRGHPKTAVELVERYFRRISESDLVRRLHGFDLLARAQLALQALDSARAAVDEVGRIVARSATPLMRASAQELAAMIATAEGHLDEARRLFEDAIDGYDLALAPYEATAARLRLGEVLGALERDEPARKIFESARAAAERLGAARLAKLAESSNPARTVPESAALSAREIEVLALVAQGCSNQEIGERLFISAFTVKRHIANILTKLDLPTRAAAAAYAIREGLAR
jgi:LuxR family maltose regulon positive regulatory protein